MVTLQIKFYDDAPTVDAHGNTVPSTWETIGQYTTARAAFRRGLKLESSNMANGVDCAIRVLDANGNEISGDL